MDRKREEERDRDRKTGKEREKDKEREREREKTRDRDEENERDRERNRHQERNRDQERDTEISEPASGLIPLFSLFSVLAISRSSWPSPRPSTENLLLFIYIKSTCPMY